MACDVTLSTWTVKQVGLLMLSGALPLIYFLTIISNVLGSGIVQRRDNCGRHAGIPNDGNIPYIEGTEYNVTSHARRGLQVGYDKSRTCIHTVRGRQGYQWTISVVFLQVDSQADIDRVRRVPRKCHDSLKIFDAARADGAFRLTPVTGLCGNESAVRGLLGPFLTCQNYVTFEFTTDDIQEEFRGFVVRMYQTPWAHRGTRFRTTDMFASTLGSCMPTQFQVNWRYQELQKSEQSFQDVEKDTHKFGTTWCYECNYCNVDYFEPKLYPSAAKTGCYLCHKQHIIGQGVAKRICFTERDFVYFMDDVIQEGSSIIKDTRKYIGCFQHTTRENQVKKLCFCEGDYCNISSTLICCHYLYIIVLFSILLLLL